MSGYASRTNPLLLHRLPPQNGPSTSHHPYERTERSLPAQGSYQSRALPPSFAESYSPHVDKRSAQRHEPRLSNPNELDRVAIPSHYFPSVPRAATRPREASDEQMAGDSDYDRRAGPVPYGQPRTADIAGMGMGERANGADDERMEIDGDDDAAKAKKRSRTLTTAHQTSVLNALLAKTRFPSTETREEVGHQIGMSARRVQIWFQNRRQSQKRARDREVTEVNSPSAYSSELPPFAPIDRLLRTGPPANYSHTPMHPPSFHRTPSSSSAGTLKPMLSAELISPTPRYAHPPAFLTRPHSMESVTSVESSSSIGRDRELRRGGPTETLQTLPESPQSAQSGTPTAGWDARAKGMEGYRLSYSSQRPPHGDTSHHHRFTPVNPPATSSRKFLFPPIEIASSTSDTNSVRTSSSSWTGRDSLLHNSVHSRTSSATSASWDDKLALSKLQEPSVARRTLLPPLSDLLEIGRAELSKKTLPPTPPFFPSAPNPSKAGYGRPPPAPSTGAKNNYHHHAFNPRLSSSSTATTSSTRSAVSSQPSLSASTVEMDDRSLPKLDRLKISNSSGARNSSIVSNRSSMHSVASSYARDSEADSFYSFGSEGSKSPETTMQDVDDGLDAAMALMGRERGGRYITRRDYPALAAPVPINLHLNYPAHDSSTTLAPILPSLGRGEGTNGNGTARLTRLPSLSAITASTPKEMPRQVPPPTHKASGSLFSGRPFEHKHRPNDDGRHRFGEQNLVGLGME